MMTPRKRRVGQRRALSAVPTTSLIVNRGIGGHASLCPPYTFSYHSLCRRVLSVLHGEDDARAVVQTVAVLFGEIIDALAGGDFTFGQQSLTDRVAEFARPGLCRLQGHRDHALEHLKGIVGMSGELAAAVGAVFRLIGGVERQTRLFG